MAEDLPTEEQAELRVNQGKQGGLTVYLLEGTLKRETFPLFYKSLDLQNPFIVDIGKVTVSKESILCLAGLALDHTFLIRGASFGFRLITQNYFDPAMFCDSSSLTIASTT
jgi:hypothetical protein